MISAPAFEQPFAARSFRFAAGSPKPRRPNSAATAPDQGADISGCAFPKSHRMSSKPPAPGRDFPWISSRERPRQSPLGPNRGRSVEGRGGVGMAGASGDSHPFRVLLQGVSHRRRGAAADLRAAGILRPSGPLACLIFGNSGD